MRKNALLGRFCIFMKRLFLFFIIAIVALHGKILFARPLTERLSGWILLQVQSRGEAWYVDPLEQKRIYLPNGQAVFRLIEKRGLGITNEALNRIPIGIDTAFQLSDSDGDGVSDKLERALHFDPFSQDSDRDGYNDAYEITQGYSPQGKQQIIPDDSLIERLKGRILLQVQQRGEAWYLNPQDGKRYYLADAETAYAVMRHLSLGITNNDLMKIPVSDIVLSYETSDRSPSFSCEDFRENALRNYCYLFTAVSTYHTPLCEKTEFSDLCTFLIFVLIAKEKNDWQSCSSLSNSQQQRECRKEIFSHFADAAWCLSLQQNYRDQCLHAIAQRNNDPHICTSIIEENLKKSCIRSVVLHSNDLSACFDISHTIEEIDICQMHIASFSENPTYCEVLFDRERKDQCFQVVARKVLDENICQNIGTETGIQNCRVQVQHIRRIFDLCRNFESEQQTICFMTASRIFSHQ